MRANASYYPKNNLVLIPSSPTRVYYQTFTFNIVLIPGLFHTDSAQKHSFLIDSSLYHFLLKIYIFFYTSNSEMSLLVPLSVDPPTHDEVYLTFSSSQRFDYITDSPKSNHIQMINSQLFSLSRFYFCSCYDWILMSKNQSNSFKFILLLSYFSPI